MTLLPFPAQGATSWYTYAQSLDTAVRSPTGGGGTSPFASVLTYGATGNGTTDDTAAINSAITANPGKTVFLPAGTYSINATANTGANSQPVGIMMNQPNVRLLLDPGAVIKMQTTSSANHSPIQVTAAHCTIEGGTLIGDALTHTATTGEFGYGIDVNAGGDNCLIKDIVLREMWGDGCLIMGKAQDTTLLNVTAVYNRRQGCSVIDSIRTKILGGFYGHTGRGAGGFVDPAAGIDLEPDPNTTRDVIDCLVSGVLFADNTGPGFVSSSNGRTLTATVVGCRSVGNGDSSTGWIGEYRMYGATNKTRLIGCSAESSLQGSGFFTTTDAVGIQFLSCTANGNPLHGFEMNGTRMTLQNCTATGNGGNGVVAQTGSSGAVLSSVTATGNGTAGTYKNQFDIYAVNTRVVGCIANTGGATTDYGFVIRTESTGTKVIGSAAVGTFAQANILVQPSDTIVSPGV